MPKTSTTTDTGASAPVSNETAQPSPGVTRQAIVIVLAESAGPMTIREIERAVAKRQPSLVRDPVENVVDTLVQDELVERASRDSRRLQLSERGRKFASGVRALAAG
jgi:hypothetical protein